MQKGIRKLQTDLPQPNRIENCSLIPPLVLAAFLVLGSVSLLVSIDDTKEFINRTGGQHCWLYSDINIYTEYYVAELGITGLAFAALLYAKKRNNCRWSMNIMVSFLALWICQLVANALSCWN